MVPLEQSWSAADNSRVVSLLLSLRWTALHEEPETFSTEKYVNRLQCHTSYSQCRARVRGEILFFFVRSSSNQTSIISDDAQRRQLRLFNLISTTVATRATDTFNRKFIFIVFLYSMLMRGFL